MATVKVRIAVAVDLDGCIGIACASPDDKHDDKFAASEAMAALADSIGSDDAALAVVYFIEADLPIPSPQTISGRVAQTPAPLSDDSIDKIAHSMPNNLEGFCKDWGYLQFARAIERAHNIPPARPENKR